MSEKNKNLSNNPINRASMPKSVEDKENSFVPPEGINSDVDIKKLTEEIEKEPMNPYRYCDRAGGYYKLNMFEKALEDIDKAIEMYNKEWQFFANKGGILANLSRYGEAIKCFSKAIEAEPKDAFLYGRRGFCFFNNKDYASAIEDFKTAIKLGAQEAVYFFNLANSLKCNKEYEEALYYIDKAIEIEANDFGQCFDSEDQLEGMTAFLERREKNFKNK